MHRHVSRESHTIARVVSFVCVSALARISRAWPVRGVSLVSLSSLLAHPLHPGMFGESQRANAISMGASGA